MAGVWISGRLPYCPEPTELKEDPSIHPQSACFSRERPTSPDDFPQKREREREESFSKLFITVLLSLVESAGAIEARSARPLPCWSTRRLLGAEWHRAHSGPLSPANSADFTCHVSVGLISVIIMRNHLRSALHDHDRRRHLSPPLVFRDRCDGRSIQSGALIASTTGRDRCRVHPKITFSPHPTRNPIKFGNLCLFKLSSLAFILTLLVRKSCFL